MLKAVLKAVLEYPSSIHTLTLRLKFLRVVFSN